MKSLTTLFGLLAIVGCGSSTVEDASDGTSAIHSGPPTAEETFALELVGQIAAQKTFCPMDGDCSQNSLLVTGAGGLEGQFTLTVNGEQTSGPRWGILDANGILNGEILRETDVVHRDVIRKTFHESLSPTDYEVRLDAPGGGYLVVFALSQAACGFVLTPITEESAERRGTVDVGSTNWVARACMKAAAEPPTEESAGPTPG